MQLSPSAHVDTFSRDNLPPPDQWPELSCALPELQYPERLNVGVELLETTMAAHGPDRSCVLAGDQRWSYAEVLRRADQIAAVLVEDFGLVPGNRVLLRGPNSPWLVACWLAVLRAGGVAVATMPLLRRREIEVICEIAEVDLALCDHRFLADLEAADVPGLRTMAYGGDDNEDLVRRAASKPVPFAPVDTAADDVAILAFTSGTTGRPKATMHFHRDLLAVADTFSRHLLRPTPEDVFTGTPPLAFTFGLGAVVLFALRAGAATLLVEKAAPEELADLVAAHHVTVLSTAPMTYRALAALNHPERLASLRRCVSAGETLPRGVWDAFHQATGVKIIDGIGSTEMLHIFIAAADKDIRPGSTGLPVPGYQAAVLDDDGTPVRDGEIGHLAVKGPTGCRYLADDRQRSYVRGGWNYTGDTYLRDADGYFWFQARSDDMIISSGYNIAGPEVEAALLRHPDVLECGVVGTPDAERGQLVTAYVVLRDGLSAAADTAAQLQAFVKGDIAPYKYPRLVHFVAELPRTNTGKLQRFRLREAAGSR